MKTKQLLSWKHKVPRTIYLFFILSILFFLGLYRVLAVQLAYGAWNKIAYLTASAFGQKIVIFPSLVPGQPFHPVASKEIGPSGGMVELPNVARLEIPAGALKKPTTVKIIQVLLIRAHKESCGLSLHAPGDGRICFPGPGYMAPVVRLEPFGLELNIPAKFSFVPDAVKVGSNPPSFYGFVATDSISDDEWSFSPYLKRPDVWIRRVSHSEKIGVWQFAYITKEFIPEM